MTIVERIKEVSKNKNLNLKSTAIKAGLSENAIYKWNTQKPNADALKAVADVLGVSVDYLLGNTDEMHPTKTNNKEELKPEDIVVLNKIRTAGLNDEQLKKLDDYIEFLKYDYIREMQDDE
ncbi:helix-turn-helix domain-containing protein [Weissella minor]|uniref:HTH cro/C1-type domain-containing protein n=1 Tax=Weissella minor TaxID=1620 RepID=A0A0R2JIZ5_9LACO|nr:helix-turn-helix transcriptional regulator [Weissella minor]KRN77232.1 hypothetical protein IV67_GL000017 [Weissella minor]